MALLLFLFSVIAGLLVAPTTTTAAVILFSEPFNPIPGGKTLTDGDDTLSIGTDCGLAIYKGKTLKYKVPSPIPASSDCSIYLNNHGVLYAHPNDIRIAPMPLLGSPSSYGRYALILDGGKLNIYGPALWSNGVGFNHTTALEHDHHYTMKSAAAAAAAATANRIIYSGQYFDASSNGDVIVAAYAGVSVLLKPECTISILAKNGSAIWGAFKPGYKVKGQCRLELRDDGEVVIGDRVKHGNGVPKTIVHEVWRSGHSSAATKVYAGVLRSNGELLVYGLPVNGGKISSTTEGDQIKMVAEA